MKPELAQLSHLDLFEYIRKNELSSSEIDSIDKEFKSRGFEFEKINEWQKKKPIEGEGLSTRHKWKVILMPFSSSLIALILSIINFLILSPTPSRVFGLTFIFLYYGVNSINKEKQFWKYFTISFVLYNILTIMFFLIIE